jgi:hypothetical protein
MRLTEQNIDKALGYRVKFNDKNHITVPIPLPGQYYANITYLTETLYYTIQLVNCIENTVEQKGEQLNNHYYVNVDTLLVYPGGKLCLLGAFIIYLQEGEGYDGF